MICENKYKKKLLFTVIYFLFNITIATQTLPIRSDTELYVVVWYVLVTANNGLFVILFVGFLCLFVLDVKFNGAREFTMNKLADHRQYTIHKYTSSIHAHWHCWSDYQKQEQEDRFDDWKETSNVQKSYSKWKTKGRKKEEHIPRFSPSTKKPRKHSSVSQSTPINACSNSCNFLHQSTKNISSARIFQAFWELMSL